MLSTSSVYSFLFDEINLKFIFSFLKISTLPERFSAFLPAWRMRIRIADFDVFVC